MLKNTDPISQRTYNAGEIGASAIPNARARLSVRELADIKDCRVAKRSGNRRPGRAGALLDLLQTRHRSGKHPILALVIRCSASITHERFVKALTRPICDS